MKTFFQKHAKKWSRCTAAALIAGGLLTIPAFAAEITPSVTKITLAQSQKSFTVDVSLQESEQFAGAEFGLKLPDGMTLDQVEFLDQTIQDAAHTPEVTADGLSFFGFYAAENVFSGKMNVARLTFIYDGAADASIVLGRSKVVTVQEDGTTVGDTSSEPFTIEVTRKSSSSSGGSSSGNSSSGNTGTPKPEQPSNPFTDLDRPLGERCGAGSGTRRFVQRYQCDNVQPEPAGYPWNACNRAASDGRNACGQWTAVCRCRFGCLLCGCGCMGSGTRDCRRNQ